MVWRGLSDRVISSGRGDGDKNGGCPILTPKVEGNIASQRLREEAQAVLRRGDGGLGACLFGCHFSSTRLNTLSISSSDGGRRT
jgi:hypothetical protein